MRHRLLILAAATALLAAASLGISVSGAFFQDTEQTPQAITADEPTRWLHLYSQPTDPDGLTGYAQKPDLSAPVATGSDAGLAVNLGKPDSNASWPQFTRSFVIQAADPFPEAGVASIEVGSNVVNDGGAPAKPLENVRLSTLDGTQSTPSATLAAGERRQVDLKASTAGLADGLSLTATVELTIHFNDGSQLGYHVPVEVCTGGADPCP